MARPARVRIRSRKPCVLARRRLLGWKVRLLTGTPQRQCRRRLAEGEPVRPGRRGRSATVLQQFVQGKCFHRTLNNILQLLQLDKNTNNRVYRPSAPAEATRLVDAYSRAVHGTPIAPVKAKSAAQRRTRVHRATSVAEQWLPGFPDSHVHNPPVEALYVNLGSSVVDHPVGLLGSALTPAQRRRLPHPSTWSTCCGQLCGRALVPSRRPA